MAATTTPPVSVEEYLSTVYEPDCDYVDGVLEERNVGEIDHGFVQGRFAHISWRLNRDTGLVPMTEVGLRLRERTYRIPDVMVTPGKPTGRVVTTPPVLCIEVLSPEDRMSRVNVRIKEFLDFGVPVVWLIDPEARRVWIYRPNAPIVEASGSVKLEGTSVEVPFSEIFD